MKLATEKRTVEMSGFENPAQEFRIKTSAAAFKILSSSLYKDKILAVVRELSCNALDAHKAAGTEDVPFQIHLPNSFEPYFSIRDRGTGLSESQVMNLYTTYFDSTKSDSNEYVGQLGLGSKSPFSYADQFTVNAYFEGEKKTYTAFISENGTPSIIKIHEEPTSEPNGLEIYMMVQPEDFGHFADRARRVLHRFPVLPELTGNRDADLTQVKYLMDTPRYKLRDVADGRYFHQNTNGCYAVQGTVAYPISVSSFNIELTDIQRDLLSSMPLDIIFQIGELDIAPSREELSYDKRTQANIVKALDEIVAHIPVFAKDVLAEADTLWKAKYLYNKWFASRSPQSAFMRKALNGKLEWNGKEITNGEMVIRMYDPKHVKAKKFKTSGGGTGTISLSVEEETDEKTQFFGDIVTIDRYDLRRGSSKATGQYHQKVHVRPGDDNLVLIIMDDPTLKRSAVKRLIHNYSGQEVLPIVFRPEPGYEDKLKDQLDGFDDWVKLSELDPPPPADPLAVKARKEVKVLSQVTGIQNYRWGCPLYTADINHDISEGGIYFMTYHKEVIQPGKDKFDKGKEPPTCTTEQYEALARLFQLRLLTTTGDKKVFTVNSSQRHQVEGKEGWVEGWSYLKEQLQEKLKDPVFQDYLELNSAVGPMVKNHSTFVSYAFKNPEFTSLPLKKSSSKFLAAAQTLQVLKDKLALYLNIASGDVRPDHFVDVSKLPGEASELFGVKIKLKSINPKLKKLLVEVDESYPELASILSNATDYANKLKTESNKRRVAFYIDLCDAAPSLVKQYRDADKSV